jgi:hypothetical protein
MLKAGSKYQYLVRGMTKLKPGEAFHAEKGHDFTCQPESFRNVLYQAASTAGHGWHVSAVIVGNTVVWACWKASDYMRPNLPAYPIVKRMKGEQ